MINENGPLMVTKFISIPKDYGTLNCNAFVAGIIEGILDAAEFVKLLDIFINILSLVE